MVDSPGSRGTAAVLWCSSAIVQFATAPVQIFGIVTMVEFSDHRTGDRGATAGSFFVRDELQASIARRHEIDVAVPNRIAIQLTWVYLGTSLRPRQRGPQTFA